jgi:8-oxo-dGTP diphosphatase
MMCSLHARRLLLHTSILRKPMKREFPEAPLVGVGAIIIEDARVVLVKRLHPPLQAEWSIPGGVLEVGELVREAAIREAREETGLTVEPGELLGVYDRILRDPEQRVQYHYVLIDFLCRRVAGSLAAASDAAEVKWFSREELPALNLAEDTLDVIRKGFATLEVGRGSRRIGRHEHNWKK